MKNIWRFTVIIATISFLMIGTNSTAHVAAEDIIVGYIESDQGRFYALDDAIQAAQKGDTLHVFGGSYTSPIVISKSLTLVGHNQPVLDGEGRGTVVKITAPNVLIQGFTILNSGASLDEENSGIAVEASGATVQDNQFRNTLFGIYLRKASNSTIRNNIIDTKRLDLPRRGDPIRVWYSNDVLIENNEVTEGRDVVLWYSERLIIRGNKVSGGRYGLHFMYCDDATIDNNWLVDNSVGAFLMYSRRLRFHRNYVSNNRGPSGFGVGLKDMDDAIIRDNLFVDNQIGASLDNSPREIDSTVLFEGNLFSFNNIGIKFTPSVRKNQFTNNSFEDNIEQISIAGRTKFLDNIWSVNGIGNYWSDYAGYDADHDGLGDIPYESRKLFENVLETHPNFRLFSFSPAAQSINLAAKALPIIRPKPKLIDKYPLMQISVSSATLIPTNSSPMSMTILSLSLFLVIGTLAYTPGLLTRGSDHHSDPLVNDFTLVVSNLTKRFGKIEVVKDICFSILPGESVALWGSNGAGKSTLIHCILGIIPAEGKVTIGNVDLANNSKPFRKLIGFVPQEIDFHPDLTVLETLDFYSGLRGVPKSVGEKLLKKLDLHDHSDKRIAQLSGGLKQRLALSLALLSDPPVLVLDEPTTNLDSDTRSNFLIYLNELKASGKTLIFASHRHEDVVHLADRVLVMEKGLIVRDCSNREFSESMVGNRI
ncbi:MAG TPA: nitrous oxide reductase family maturation protein NosD [SAR202 cluster bacterium]|nr:nitrous oxide reductase family maturation protein NosD [SAR202 cluster bacterium]|tara:strand:- start:2498 stop:4618 length:2121 start_codon:yes stop_codon:yes gene_type:complete